jgi:hypothetical protein
MRPIKKSFSYADMFSYADKLKFSASVERLFRIQPLSHSHLYACGKGPALNSQTKKVDFSQFSPRIFLAFM